MPQRDIRSALRQRIVATEQYALDELARVATEAGQVLTKQHRRVVQRWSTGKPVFAYRVTVKPTYVRVTVFPRGPYAQRYKYVDLGTKGPYVIRAKHKPYLHFQGGYDAKTAPGAKYNVGLGGNTGNWAKKKQVVHPGIQARGFSEKFNKEVLIGFRRDINNALRRAIRRAGGG